jgi:F-type H+-transporting ATPase subunit delta
MEEIAEVYGRSLFEVAAEHDKTDVLREELGQFADALHENRDLAIFFFSPYFSTQEKKDALGGLLDGADETLVNFLELLIEKHRMPVIFRIRRVFDTHWEHDEDVARQLGDRIAETTGEKIELTATVDPDILGGIVLRVGNSILDASIRNRLDNLRKAVARGGA